MKVYQERLINLLKDVQAYGLESEASSRNPSLFTGQWMENVQTLEDLMDEIERLTPSEACMKIFNVLHPCKIRQLPRGRAEPVSEVGDKSLRAIIDA